MASATIAVAPTLCGLPFTCSTVYGKEKAPKALHAPPIESVISTIDGRKPILAKSR